MRPLFLIALLLSLSILLTGCWPADETITLPSIDGDGGDFGQRLQAINMGVDYEYRTYYNLETGQSKQVHTRDFDIAIGRAELGYPVFLNEGKLVQANATTTHDFALVHTIPSGQVWQPDAPSGNIDSLRIGRWQPHINTDGHSLVYLINRGSIFHDLSSRFYKFQVIAASGNTVQIRFAPANSTNAGSTTLTVELQSTHSLTYVCFDKGVVDIAPPDADWHVMITRHFHVFTNEPIESPLRNYSVTGMLTNRLAGVTSAQVPTPMEIADVTAATLDGLTSLAAMNTIGYDWKTFDLNTGFAIVPQRVYVIWLPNGSPFALQFIDFFDDRGQRGVPTFFYRRIPSF